MLRIRSLQDRHDRAMLAGYLAAIQDLEKYAQVQMMMGREERATVLHMGAKLLEITAEDTRTTLNTAKRIVEASNV